MAHFSLVAYFEPVFTGETGNSEQRDNLAQMTNRLWSSSGQILCVRLFWLTTSLFQKGDDMETEFNLPEEFK